MIEYENLAEACRNLDSQTEEIENFFALLRNMGFDPEAVLDVSRARALLGYTSLKGNIDEVRQDMISGAVEIEVPRDDMDIVHVLRTVWMDGMLIGNKIARSNL